VFFNYLRCLVHKPVGTNLGIESLLKKKRKTQRRAINNDEVRSRVRGHFESRGAFFFVVAFPLQIVNNNNLLFTFRTRYGFRNEKSEESTA
jgi:hypothetical protein